MPRSCASFVWDTARGKPTGQRHIYGHAAESRREIGREGRPMVFAGATEFGLLLRRQLRSRALAKGASIASVQWELSDESWIGGDRTSLDALDDGSQYCVGLARQTNLLAL